MTVDAALHQPHGFGPLDVQAPEAHFRFDDAVTTVLPLFGGVTGGFCLVAADVWPGVIPLLIVAGVLVGEVGLAIPTTGPGFGGLGGEIGLIDPPTAGGGLAAPPILFCCVLAPPSVL
jgi:hypothetical protein